MDKYTKNIKLGYSLKSCIQGFLTLTVSLYCLSLNAETSVEEPIRFGSWQVVCTTGIDSHKQCIAHQMVQKGSAPNNVVLGVMIGYQSKDPSPHLVFRFSPKADKSKGVAVKVDSEKVIKAPINQCDESVCEVKSLIPRGLSEQMKGGQTMMFAFFIEDEQIIYPVSLKGYRELYPYLTE